MTTKAEHDHLDRVASLGCIVCRRSGHGFVPALVHHLNTGGMSQRASHFMTIPLCPSHHQTGPFGHAIHNGKRTFEATYGTEAELLAHVQGLLELAS